MRQVLQSRSGETVVRDVPAPPCPPGGLLVRNEFSVISSGTERTTVDQSQKSLVGRARERPDLVREVIDRARREGMRATAEAVRRKLGEENALGYSSAGRVVEVGPAVRGFSVGDAVACAGAGFANHADVVAVPRNLCARVPDGVPLDAAAFTTIAAIALHGVRLADVRLGDRVAVVGCGLVGQITCRLLQATGAEVFAIDVDPARIEQAKAGGADHAALTTDAAEQVAAITRGAGADQVLVTAAAPTNDPLLLASEVARDRAAVVVVGDVPLEMPREALFKKELSLQVSRSYGPGRYDPDYEEGGIDYPIGYVRWTQQRNMEAILDLQARGRLDFRDLIDEVVPVHSAAHAYERLTGDDRPRGALVLSYEENGASARQGQPVTRRRRPQATDGAVRVGLIGPGSFAMAVIVPALRAAGARLELVGGGGGPSALAAARDHGFERVAESPEALIADEQVEAVVIATRHGTHAELATRALEAGKHVFCEKPLALTREELDAVMAAARGSEGTLAVGFNRRFSPALTGLRDFLRRPGEPFTGLYRVSAGHVPPGHWMHDLKEGGGRTLGEVCHFIDSLTFVAGAPVREVHAVGHGAADLPAQSHDNLTVTLRFEDGSVGSVAYVSQGAAGVAKERLEAFSGKRTAILDDYRTLELFDGSGRRVEGGKAQDKGHDAELAAFVAGVRDGRDPVALDEVENVSLATLLAVDSLRTGLPVALEDAGS